MEKNEQPVEKTNVFLVLLFWAYVTIPLAWGVYNTLLKTVELFK